MKTNDSITHTFFENMGKPLWQAAGAILSASIIYLVAFSAFPNHPLYVMMPAIASLCLATYKVDIVHQAPLLFFGRLLKVSYPAGYYLISGPPFVSGLFQMKNVYLFWNLGEQISSQNRTFTGFAFSRSKEGYLMQLDVTGIINIFNVAKMLPVGEDAMREISVATTKRFLMKHISSNDHGFLFNNSNHTYRYDEGAELLDANQNPMGVGLTINITQVREIEQGTVALFEAEAQHGQRAKVIEGLRRQFPGLSDAQYMALFASLTDKNNPGFFNFSFKE